MALSNEQLKAITDAEIKNSQGYYSGQLARSRQKSLDYYYGKATGDLAPSSIDGRSQAVDTSVRDTIEWMKPAVLRMFVSGDKIVEFQAKQPGYEQQEKSCEEYIGKHVFIVQNNGFRILDTWITDGFISKVGIVKVWHDTRKDETREEYNGLSDVELTQLLNDDSVEPIESTTTVDPQSGQTLYNIAVKRTNKYGYCKIDNVPPEEFLISRRAKTIEDSSFTAHRFERTIGQLREAGYKNVDQITDDDISSAMSDERVTRRLQNDEMGWLRETEKPLDPSMRTVWVTECFLQVDADQDGIPEWRKITRCGNTILENIECDGHPFVAFCPVPLPHQFFGLSIADLAMESQKQNTALLRAIYDNIFLSVNGRTWAVENQVNLDDLLSVRPGGVVRVKSPTAVGALQAGAGDVSGAMQVLDYANQMKGERVGFTQYSQGGNADALNKTATGVSIITNRYDMRLELIARNFGESVKSLFLKILEIVSKYQNKPEMVRATGGWLNVDPREWKNQFHLSVNVGLGTGNKDEIIQKLNTLAQAMAQAADAGIVMPNNVYNAGVKLAETLGFNNPDDYFTNPAHQPPKPPQQDPNMMQVQAAIEINKQQLALKEKETMAKISQDQLKLEADIMMKREELAAKIGIQREELNNRIITQQVANDIRRSGEENYFTGGAGAIPPQPPAFRPGV